MVARDRPARRVGHARRMGSARRRATVAVARPDGEALPRRRDGGRLLGVRDGAARRGRRARDGSAVSVPGARSRAVRAGARAARLVRPLRGAGRDGARGRVRRRLRGVRPADGARPGRCARAASKRLPRALAPARDGLAAARALPAPLARLDARRDGREWFVFNRRGLRKAVELAGWDVEEQTGILREAAGPLPDAQRASRSWKHRTGVRGRSFALRAAPTGSGTRLFGASG